MFDEDTTLTEAAVVEISDLDSETDRLVMFETPKHKESVRSDHNGRQSGLQDSKTVTPVIQDIKLEPLEGDSDTIIVNRRPHIMRPRRSA